MREKFYEQIELHIEVCENFRNEGNYKMSAFELGTIEARADLARMLGIITYDEYRDIIKRIGLVK